MLIVFSILVVFLIIFTVVCYNGLISKSNALEQTESSISVYLKNRIDLIPKLIEIGKFAFEKESKLLEKVARIRSSREHFEDLSLKEKIELEKESSSAVKSIMMLQENYPDLKSISQFKEAQQGLVEIEDKISAARRAFNSAVRQYNDSVMSFPSNLVASFTGFKREKALNFDDYEVRDLDLAKVLN